MLQWDRSGKWEVQRIFHERARLSILFQEASPSIEELLAIRRCFSEHRDLAPAALISVLHHSGRLCLGEMAGREARRLAELAASEGLNVLVENTSFVSYLPIDLATGVALLIEDDAEAKAVAEEMIAAGVPLAHVET